MRICGSGRSGSTFCRKLNSQSCWILLPSPRRSAGPWWSGPRGRNTAAPAGRCRSIGWQRDAVVLLRQVPAVGDRCATRRSSPSCVSVSVISRSRLQMTNVTIASTCCRSGRTSASAACRTACRGPRAAPSSGAGLGSSRYLAAVVDAGVLQLLGDPVLAAVPDVRPGDASTGCATLRLATSGVIAGECTQHRRAARYRPLTIGDL